MLWMKEPLIVDLEEKNIQDWAFDENRKLLKARLVFEQQLPLK